MRKIILLFGLVSQLCFAGNNTDPIEIEPPPPPKASDILSEIEVMGVILQQPQFFYGIPFVVCHELKKIEILTAKKISKDLMKFDIVIHQGISKSVENDPICKNAGKENQQLTCATVEFTGGPGTSPDGRSEAIPIKKKWWAFISIERAACK